MAEWLLIMILLSFLVIGIIYLFLIICELIFGSKELIREKLIKSEYDKGYTEGIKDISKLTKILAEIREGGKE